MQLYNEQEKPVNVSGVEKTWDRARLITIDNTYGKVPSITFVDDRITIGPLGEKHVGLPNIKIDFTTPTKEFDLIHPVTGEKIGTAEHQDLQVLLYSLYVASKTVPN